MSFLESPRFPDDIAYGATGGPEYQTDVVVVNSGHEQRNANWAAARARYDVGLGPRKQAQTYAITAFFRAVKGRKTGFRFKDWSDFEVATSNGTLATVGAGLYQLVKRYDSGALTELRDIKKPVVATIYRNGVAAVAGAGAGQYALDATTGRVTFVADITKSISGITQANPGVATTSTAHGLTTGQVVELSTIAGMTQLNGVNVTATVLTTTTFSIGVNTTAYGAYTSGGSVKKYIQASEVLTWAGEFDVPCRFDTDRLEMVIMGPQTYSWSSIPIIEIRV